MKLSIVIVNYNTRQLLQKCLETILQGLRLKAKGGKPKFEVIIVDNGSTDGSRRYLGKLSRCDIGTILEISSAKQNEIKKKKISVERISGERSEAISNITVIFNDRNLGFARAVNQGIKKSKGKYILLLNTDTEVETGSIKSLINFVEKNPQAGIVVPQLLNPDRSVQTSCYQLPTIIGAIRKFWFGQKDAFGKYAPEGKKAVEVEAAVAAVWLLPRATVEKVGLFDEKYFMYFEDLDYCQRVRKKNLKIYYLPTSQIIHLHGASGEKLGAKPNKWLTESSKKYHGFLKHFMINTIIKTSQICQKLKR